MTNPLHSGLAAKNGVLAAELASLGWTAAEDGLGARFGFGDMFASGVPIGQAFDDAGRSWDMERVWVAQKLYPSCAATHRAIDALLALRKEHGISAADVERIDCGVDYMVPTYMVYPEPLTPEQARFSMEYTLAVAMTDGRVGLEQYLASRLKDTEVRDLARRVRMYVHPDEDGPESWETRFADLEIRLRGGGTLRSRIYQQRGHPDNPLSAAELDGKYRDAAGRVLAPDAVEASLASLGDLDRLDSIGPLMLVLGGFTDAR
jgi:2-methylcitrate dehydratase PrpD